MSFALPPKIQITKTLNGNIATIVTQVQDTNGANVGPSTTYDFDTTRVSPATAYTQAFLNALTQVSNNLAWTDIPASVTLTPTDIDVILGLQE